MQRINPLKTAFLTLDVQKGIFQMANVPDSVVASAAKAADHARASGIKVIHVGLGFSPGHPELPAFLSPAKAMWSSVREKDMMVVGGKDGTAEFPEELRKEGDTVIWKHRASAFYQNQLELVLRAGGIEHLVLGGIATSGITLSTVRQAWDMDFKLTVLREMCFDRDEEVHRVLLDKVFPKQAEVVSVDDFLKCEMEQ